MKHSAASVHENHNDIYQYSMVMRNTFILLTLVFCSLAACRKEPTREKPLPAFTLDSVKQWFSNQAATTQQTLSVSSKTGFSLGKLHLDWSRAQSMPMQNDNYWLIALDGQPTFQGAKQGYRKIAFQRGKDGKIKVYILEFVPDGLTYQRLQKMTTKDFTGRVFVYDQNYQLLGGEILAGGKKIGTIKPAPKTTDTGKLRVQSMAAISVSCNWVDDNYIDAEEGVVIYSYQVCDYSISDDGGGGGGGFSGGSGDYAGGGGGGGGTASSAPAVSNLPGESGPKTAPKKYMDCFGNIPDQGAVMKVTVYVQEPWPGTSFNIGPNSVGHTAIGLTKSGGGVTIMQVVGFYPDATGFAKIHAPSKIVDNSAIEYNSSISYTVNASQFSQIVNYVANPPATYDLNNFNCTNFVYTACSKGGIQLPDPYSIVGLSGAGTLAQDMTPGGLGSSIDDMKGQSNVNTTGGITPNSKGPCN
jgi:hypothetical protein